MCHDTRTSRLCGRAPFDDMLCKGERNLGEGSEVENSIESVRKECVA